MNFLSLNKKRMTDSKFSFFVAIADYNDLKYIANVIPKTVKMYVKAEMETPGTRKIALAWHNKTTVDHVTKVIPCLIEICGSACYAKQRHILTTKYVAWKQWMRETDYEKLSDKVRKRCKFLNRPFMLSETNPYKVKNFFLQ